MSTSRGIRCVADTWATAVSCSGLCFLLTYYYSCVWMCVIYGGTCVSQHVFRDQRKTVERVLFFLLCVNSETPVIRLAWHTPWPLESPCQDLACAFSVPRTASLLLHNTPTVSEGQEAALLLLAQSWLLWVMGTWDASSLTQLCALGQRLVSGLFLRLAQEASDASHSRLQLTRLNVVRPMRERPGPSRLTCFNRAARVGGFREGCTFQKNSAL